MATPPTVLKENFLKEVMVFEQKIDDLLKSQRLYSSEIYITPPSDMTFAHFVQIKERYLSAGWKDVKWDDNQHDGKTLVFSIVEPSYNNYMDR